MKSYKFFATDKLKSILDANELNDLTAEKAIRAVLLGRFSKDIGVNSLSIGTTDEDQKEFCEDTHFSMQGCDCCTHGLGNDVYSVIGYSKEFGVVDVGELCGSCIDVAYNGI